MPVEQLSTTAPKQRKLPPTDDEFSAMPYWHRVLVRKLWDGEHVFPSEDDLPLPVEIVSTKTRKQVPLHVYFIQEADGGAIKIGVAVDPAKRLCGLQVGNPRRLSLIAVCDGGTLQESRYHCQFREHWVGGEWFAPHSDILAEVTRITALTEGNGNG